MKSKKKIEHKDSTIYQTNENCQVFTGPISGCVFAMPGATVNQSPVQKVDAAKQERPATDKQERNEERFHFVHPEIEDEEAWRIHDAVKRLVAYQKVPEICAYLKVQKMKEKLLLPPNPSFVYEELKRLGMPTGDGYGEKYFAACYKK